MKQVIRDNSATILLSDVEGDDVTIWVYQEGQRRSILLKAHGPDTQYMENPVMVFDLYYGVKILHRKTFENTVRGLLEAGCKVYGCATYREAMEWVMGGKEIPK